MRVRWLSDVFDTKRTLDIGLSAFALGLFVPVQIASSIAIRREDGLWRQGCKALTRTRCALRASGLGGAGSAAHCDLLRDECRRQRSREARIAVFTTCNLQVAQATCNLEVAYPLKQRNEFRLGHAHGLIQKRDDDLALEDLVFGLIPSVRSAACDDLEKVRCVSLRCSLVRERRAYDVYPSGVGVARKVIHRLLQLGICDARLLPRGVMREPVLKTFPHACCDRG